MTLAAALAATPLAKSLSDARRTINQGAASVNGAVVPEDRPLTEADLLYGRWLLLREGKRNYHLLSAAGWPAWRGRYPGLASAAPGAACGRPPGPAAGGHQGGQRERRPPPAARRPLTRTRSAAREAAPPAARSVSLCATVSSLRMVTVAPEVTVRVSGENMQFLMMIVSVAAPAAEGHR